MSRSVTPTPFPQVNVLVEELLESARSILGANFIGMYLFGSLAMGDFDDASDIDVAIVTQDEISPAVFAQLRDMHARIGEQDAVLARDMEVSYLTRQALRRYDPANSKHPRLQRGSAEVLEMDNHVRVVERHVLREHGVVVTGPSLHDLIDPVSPDDLRALVLEVLQEWIVPLVKEQQPFDSRGEQSYTVLCCVGCCTSLNTGP